MYFLFFFFWTVVRVVEPNFAKDLGGPRFEERNLVFIILSRYLFLATNADRSAPFDPPFDPPCALLRGTAGAQLLLPVGHVER